MPPGAVIKSAAPIVVAKILKFPLRGGVQTVMAAQNSRFLKVFQNAAPKQSATRGGDPKCRPYSCSGKLQIFDYGGGVQTVLAAQNSRFLKVFFFIYLRTSQKMPPLIKVPPGAIRHLCPPPLGTPLGGCGCGEG